MYYLYKENTGYIIFVIFMRFKKRCERRFYDEYAIILNFIALVKLFLRNTSLFGRTTDFDEFA